MQFLYDESNHVSFCRALLPTITQQFGPSPFRLHLRINVSPFAFDDPEVQTTHTQISIETI